MVQKLIVGPLLLVARLTCPDNLFGLTNSPQRRQLLQQEKTKQIRSFEHLQQEIDNLHLFSIYSRKHTQIRSFEHSQQEKQTNQIFRTFKGGKNKQIISFEHIQQGRAKKLDLLNIYNRNKKTNELDLRCFLLQEKGYKLDQSKSTQNEFGQCLQ